MKNKKGIFKKGVACALMLGAFGMSACSLGGAKIEDYDIENIDSPQYNVYDTFTLNGYKLKLTMSDGSTKEIDLNDDMLKSRPDMNSAGTKEIKVLYDGKEYKFSITVKGYTKEEMLQKIQAFKADYEGLKDISDMKLSVDYNVYAKYLDEEANIEGGDTLAEFSYNKTQGDNMVNNVITNLLTSITENGMNVQMEDIINSNELKSRLDAVKAVSEAADKISEFNFKNYLINDLMFSGTVADNATMIADFISDKIAYLDKDDKGSGYREIYFWAVKNVNAIKQLKNIDVKAEMQELVDLLDEYGVYDDGGEEFISSLKSNLDAGTYNVLSDYAQYLIDEGDIVSAYIASEQGSGLDEKVETEEANILGTRAVTAVKDFIVCLENIVFGDGDFSDKLDSLKSACRNYISIEDEYAAKGWVMVHENTIADSYFAYMIRPIAAQLDTYNEIKEGTFNFVSSYLKNCNFDITTTYYYDDGESAIEIYEGVIVETPEALQLSLNVKEKLIAVVSQLEKMVLRSEDFNAELAELKEITQSLLDLKDTYNENNWDCPGFFDLVAVINMSCDYGDIVYEEIKNGTWHPISELLKTLAEEDLFGFEICAWEWNGDLEDWDYIAVDDPEAIQLAEDMKDKFINAVEKTETLLSSGEGLEEAKTALNAFIDLREVCYDNDWEVPEVALDLAVTALDGLEFYEQLNDGVDNFIEANESGVITAITDLLANFLNVEYETRAYVELETLVTIHVDNYVKDRFEVETFVEELNEFVDEYCEEEYKVMFKAALINYLVASGEKFSDIDFNEMFENVQLPDAIESIDYNKFFNKLISENKIGKNYKIKGVDLNYVTDLQGNIVKEVLSITYAVDTDVEIAQVNGEYKINLEITL